MTITMTRYEKALGNYDACVRRYDEKPSWREKLQAEIDEAYEDADHYAQAAKAATVLEDECIKAGNKTEAHGWSLQHGYWKNKARETRAEANKRAKMLNVRR